MINKKWASLHGHSFFSLLDGLSNPLDLFERAIEANLFALSLTDHGGVSGSIKLLKSRKQYIDKIKSKVEKCNDNEQKNLFLEKIEKAETLRLILGNEIYLAVSEKENAHLVVLAKNLAGYKQLIKATSESTRRENFYRKPRLSIDQLSQYVGNLIVINGHPGSSLYRVLWSDVKASFNAYTYEEAKQLVHPDWRKRVLEEANKFKDIFGENFVLESQLIDKDRLPAAQIAVNIYRWVSKKTGIRISASADHHYSTPSQCEDQRVLLASALKTTLPKIKRQMANDEDDIALGGFFKSDRYYLPSSEEMISLHTEEEIQTSVDIASSIDDYDLSSKPIIPKFECPDGKTSSEYMLELCRNGWKDKLPHLRGEEKKVYADRVKHELEVLQGAGLDDYFLVVADIMNWVKSQGYLTGPGRGSSAGCLTSFLMGITAVDPIKYGLIFERFYNAGRNSPGRISMPDIDCDVQAGIRDRVVNYIKDKYGRTKVGQISNYGRLQGRSCIKDVLRANESCDFQTMNEICKYIPDEAAIADELQEMQDEFGEKSILRWALENSAKELSEWAQLAEDGSVQGPLAAEFAQAIRLEGTYRQRGVHAAAVVIYPEDITDICPVVYDKEGNGIIAYDMHDVEYTGGNKLDILGITIADKIHGAQQAITKEFLL